MSIREFLTGIGLERYADSFEENGIEVDILPELEEADLPDLGVKLLGHRKKLMKAIRLQGPSSKEIVAARAEGTNPPATRPEPAAVAPEPAAVAPEPKAAAPAPRPKRRLSKRIPPPAPKPAVAAADAIPSSPGPTKPEGASKLQGRPKRRVRRKKELAETRLEEVPDEVPLAPESQEKASAPTGTGTGPRIKRLKKRATNKGTKAAQNAVTGEVASVPSASNKKKRGAGKKKVTRGEKVAGFSETQWFMAGAKKDADILEAKAESDEYAHDENISEEERQEYTLRTPDD